MISKEKAREVLVRLQTDTSNEATKEFLSVFEGIIKNEIRKYTLTGDLHTDQDIFQSVMYRVLKGARHYKKDKSALLYIICITRNLCRDAISYYNRAKRKNRGRKLTIEEVKSIPSIDSTSISLFLKDLYNPIERSIIIDFYINKKEQLSLSKKYGVSITTLRKVAKDLKNHATHETFYKA
jgi:RNA polymerase sigma factor (sigma-70 family)